MRFRTATLALCISLVALIAACDSDLPTTEARSRDAGTVDARPEESAPSANSENACPNCTFGPTLYTRTTGIPVRERAEFEGDPRGAYTLETDDLETRGAESRLWLNGERMKVRPGLHKQDVVLARDNTLEVRLTGKPGSKLRVRIFQEVETVEVTPEQAEGHIQASQQFTAVALDRNGVEIPTQTFTWESGDLSIARLMVPDGPAREVLARTVGAEHDAEAWSYKTTSTGEGPVEITAHADGSDERGAATWDVVSGFVYVTYRAPPPGSGPWSLPLPDSFAYRYDEERLDEMHGTCGSESSDTEWRDHITRRQRQFKRCYPSLEHSTPTRRKNVIGNWVDALPTSNVGLYGRYCGGGHPDGNWMDDARDGGYQPKDPADAVCMEHDRSPEHHQIDPLRLKKAACIVRFGLEAEKLYFEGKRVPEGSARWDEFWSRWPEMAESRSHWLDETTGVTRCGDLVLYDNFLDERGLPRP